MLGAVLSEEIVSTSTQYFVDPGQVHERRQHPRVLPKTLVYVACGAANGGMVLNASDDGLAISMAIAVGGESFSSLRVRMNGLPQVIEVNGKVVWTTVSKRRAGIQLLDVTGLQRSQICEWLAFEGVREVHLVAQDLPKVAATVAPVFDESRYSLLQAFGGTAPEFLGPLPSLLEQSVENQQRQPGTIPLNGISGESQPYQDFTSAGQTGLRDNEWDLADVTLLPRKKTSRTKLSAPVLMFLWIAIPCFGIGMLVGRRPLEQWLARADANGENISQPGTSVSRPLSDSQHPAVYRKADAAEAAPSLQDAAFSHLHVDTTNYAALDSTAISPLPQETGASLLNSLSTQEVRAIKKSNDVSAAPPQPPAASYTPGNPVSPGRSSLPSVKPAAIPAPAVATAAAPQQHKPDNSPAPPLPVSTVNTSPAAGALIPTRDDKNSSPLISATRPDAGSVAEQNYDQRMPKTISVDSSLRSSNTPQVSAPGSTQPAPPAAAPAMRPRNSGLAASPSSLSAPSLNPAPARPVASGSLPSIAPASAQPPLRGVMLVARKSDESFLLRLPLESVPGGHSTSIRMQRFVIVPRQSRWHRRNPIAKLTVGELLSHDALETPRLTGVGSGDVVTVRASVDKNGNVQGLKPISGRFALLPRVMRTVRDWQFNQTLLDGKTVESEVNVTVEFRPAH